MLAPRLGGAVFLDAYAGSGAVGIEALSRGAKRAIFIERNAQAVAVIRENLRSLGVEPEAIVVRGSAATLLRNYKPDIAFIDMNMPEHLGTEVLAHIRATPRLANVKTVMVTANTHADALAEEYNVDLFLVKPVPLQEMIQLAQRLTGMDFKH